MTLRSVTRDTFDELVGTVAGHSFIDVWGPECRPCLALAPTYSSLAEQYRDRARFFKLQADTNRMLCANLRALSLPTFLYLEGGVEVDRLVGEVSADELARWIEGTLREREEVTA